MAGVGAVKLVKTDMTDNTKSRICLGKRLRSAPSFRCLGVKSNWADYSQEEQEALNGAEEVYYPSPLYEDLFLSLGKKVFPRNSTGFIGNKIRQTNLFQLLGISHPRTRLYYGRDRLRRICGDFNYPFVAKTPVGSSMGKGVWLIRSSEELESYLEKHRPAYIQEHLPIDRDLRVVLIGGEVVHAYWRIGQAGDFRNNVTQGAAVSFENIPDKALQFAESVARLCRFDEVGLDVCHARGRYYVIEANMVYGLEGFKQAGLDIYEILADLDRKGKL
jgi:ribosomal protein S6--L-glutamate ligase